MRRKLKNIAATKKLAFGLIKKWQHQKGPLVIALFGELGAGKTTFTRFLAQAAGVREKVLSPTFLIIKSFPLKKPSGFKFFVHIDSYRLKSANELVSLGLKKILKNHNNIVVVEWPGKVNRYLPKNTKRLHLKITGEKKRTIKINE